MSEYGIKVTLGPGEFIDRLTILRLKLHHAQEPTLRDALMNRLDEYATQRIGMPDHPELAGLEKALADINKALWKAENEVRRTGHGEAAFQAVSRQIPVLNDQRASLKEMIDGLFGWGTVETKCYSR